MTAFLSYEDGRRSRFPRWFGKGKAAIFREVSIRIFFGRHFLSRR
jgi:hypothetical protein